MKKDISSEEKNEGSSDLKEFKALWDKLGIKYHEMKESGYTYISKLHAHEEPGYIRAGFKSVKLKSAEQLCAGREFFEFDETGKLASW